ncbi:hypothetical protein AGMMS4956_19740 [Bacteroidia bacterium]|nr:hypothetical protein AGMMS4956_19740 [Bacteroidia bacterium]
MVVLSIESSLLNFSKKLDDTFFASLRDVFFGEQGTGTNGLWGTWYAMIASPLLIMFAVKGIQLMMGSIDGQKLQKELRQFGYALLFLGFGMFAMPIIELVAKELNGFMKEKVVNTAGQMYDANAKKLAALKQQESAIQSAVFKSVTGIDPETSEFIRNNTTTENILLDQTAQQEAKKQSQVLDKQDVARLQEIQHESGAADNLTNIILETDIAALKDINKIEAKNKTWDAVRNMNPENFEIETEDKSLLSWGPVDIVTSIFTILGALIQVIILFIRGVLLIILRFSLPIVIAMSFFPTFEGVVKEWWESYKSLALWLIPITVIEVISQVSWCVARTNVDIENVGIMNAMTAFVCGILYLLVPTLTSMMFGGSPAMAGISQQIMSAGAVMYSLTKGAAGSIYNVKKDKDGNKSVGGLVGFANKVDAGARSVVDAIGGKGDKPKPVG